MLSSNPIGTHYYILLQCTDNEKIQEAMSIVHFNVWRLSIKTRALYATQELGYYWLVMIHDCMSKKITKCQYQGKFIRFTT